MHGFSIVLEDGSEGFYEDEHARYILLYEQLLTETADERGTKFFMALM